VHPGFSVFAGPPVEAAALTSLESQARYITRLALAMDALQKLDDGNLALETPPDPRTGATLLALDPLEWIHRTLPRTSPDPGRHCQRFYGCVSPKLRQEIESCSYGERQDGSLCYKSGPMIPSFGGFLTCLSAFFRSRCNLGLEILALRQQLGVLKRKHPRPRLRMQDRIFWVLLRRLWPGWSNVLVIVKPETVVAWHRAGFRLFWRLRSRANNKGRPKNRCRVAAFDPTDGIRESNLGRTANSR
jgi:hypothetical protein